MKSMMPIGLLLLLAGCAAPIMKTQDAVPVLPPAEAASESLSAGDQLEVIYTRTNARQPEAYLLQVGDVISIDVADQPDLTSRDVRVLPDGRISMKVIGGLLVAGRSVEDVGRAIASALERKNVPSPGVIVSVNQANAPLEQFIRNVASEAQGGRIQVRLTNDEPLALPLIAPIKAVGRSLSAVRGDAVAAYAGLFASQLNVTLNLREQSEQAAFVWGEVAKPGLLPLKARMNAAMVVAAAGGPTATADHSDVLVVRFRPDGGFYHWRIDMTSIQSAVQSPGFDLALRNRDIVFVPRSSIGDVNAFVDLYIRKNIPLSAGVGFTP